MAVYSYPPSRSPPPPQYQCQDQPPTQRQALRQRRLQQQTMEKGRKKRKLGWRHCFSKKDRGEEEEGITDDDRSFSVKVSPRSAIDGGESTAAHLWPLVSLHFRTAQLPQ